MDRIKFRQEGNATIGCDGELNGFPMGSVTKATIKLKAGKHPKITMTRNLKECEVEFLDIHANFVEKQQEGEPKKRPMDTLSEIMEMLEHHHRLERQDIVRSLNAYYNRG